MDAAEAVNTYGATWNEPDEEKRRALLDRSWSDDGVYMDPTARADGRDSLLAHIGGFHAMMPGTPIDATSDVDTHGNVFRFAWIMRNGQRNRARRHGLRRTRRRRTDPANRRLLRTVPGPLLLTSRATATRDASSARQTPAP